MSICFARVGLYQEFPSYLADRGTKRDTGKRAVVSLNAGPVCRGRGQRSKDSRPRGVTELHLALDPRSASSCAGLPVEGSYAHLLPKGSPAESQAASEEQDPRSFSVADHEALGSFLSLLRDIRAGPTPTPMVDHWICPSDAQRCSSVDAPALKTGASKRFKEIRAVARYDTSTQRQSSLQD